MKWAESLGIGFFAGCIVVFLWALAMLAWICHLKGTPDWTVGACICVGVGVWAVATMLFRRFGTPL